MLSDEFQTVGQSFHFDGVMPYLSCVLYLTKAKCTEYLAYENKSFVNMTAGAAETFLRGVFELAGTPNPPVCTYADFAVPGTSLWSHSGHLHRQPAPFKGMQPRRTVFIGWGREEIHADETPPIWRMAEWLPWIEDKRLREADTVQIKKMKIS
jgi:hypothetical protein